ncbi:MAG: hypothetical protein OCD76_25205 [Reichenbachiella sp.]
MSKDSYDALLPEIETIADAATKIPNMPVNVFLQEASDLEVWSQDDQEELLKVGVTQAVFDAMTPHIGALRHAESTWKRERFSKEEAQQEWDVSQPEALALKNELEHTFRFSFRKREDLLKKIQGIEDGIGHADMIQDLNDLSVLGKANTPLLEVIGLDLTKLDQAATTASEMSVLLATMNGERTENNYAKRIRDKAYTLLKENVDEVREAGKFVFWKNEKRIKGYKSMHWKNN